VRSTLTVARALVDHRVIGPVEIAIENGIIARVRPAPPVVRPTGVIDGLLTAGMVDLQLNGAVGVDLAGTETDAWRRMAAHQASHGVAAFAPTFITAPLEFLLDALRTTTLARYALADQPVAQPLRAHLEGPFLSPTQPGAHNPTHLRNPSPAAIDALLDGPDASSLGVVTIAPELPGGLEATRQLTAAGVTVSIGHTDATADEVARAADHGATLVTHLFNAQRRFSHRDPGVVGRALTDERLICGLIADGHHVADDAVRLAFAAAGDRIALVSDAVATAGLPPHPRPLRTQHGTTSADEPPRLADGTLAGSGLFLDVAVSNIVALGIAPELALTAATATPAAAVGHPGGRLEPGLRADLVLWDDDLRVRATWIGGCRVNAPPSGPRPELATSARP